MRAALVFVILAGTSALGLWLPRPSSRASAAEGNTRAKRHASITAGVDCSTCHTTASWRGLNDGAPGFDHARTGFPLTGRHRSAGCTDCHRPDEKISRACVACHRDAHEERLGSECADCHSSQDFRAVRAFELHRATRLPLTGMHALIDCTDCHRRTGERTFSPVAADCYACHAAEYARSDIHPRHTGTASSPAFPRDCGQCHRASSWTPAFTAPGALRQQTSALGFELQGAPFHHELAFPIQRGPHRGATCADCHASEAVPRAVRCTGCHAHGPAVLQQQHHQAGVVARDSACLSCHPGGARR